MKEFRIAKGWAIFIYILAPVMIIVFVGVMLMPFFPGMDGNLNALWLIVPVSLGMIALMVFAMIDAVKGKFVIDTDKVYTVGVFSERVLMLDEIKGYSVDEKYIFIEPHTAGKKRVKVSVYYSGKEEIINWLASRYPDVHVLMAAREEAGILNNEEIGFTIEQRSNLLNKARRAALILNWAGGIAGAWVLFWASPYEYAVIACAAVPVLSILAMKYFKGLIRINDIKGSAYPSVFIALFGSGMGLFLRSLFDFDVFDYTNLWKPTILICVSFIAAMVIGSKEITFKKGIEFFTLLSLSMFMLGYSYGVVVIANCYYDQSAPTEYHAKVMGKRMSSGKTTSYYLELTPWGPQKEADEVSVSQDLYNEIDENDEVTIYFFTGKFDIPWFRVTR